MIARDGASDPPAQVFSDTLKWHARNLVLARIAWQVRRGMYADVLTRSSTVEPVPSMEAAR